MKRLRVYFSPEYAPDEVPTLARLAVAAELIAREPAVEVVAPPAFDARELDGLHAPNYLHAFLAGTEPLASSQGIAWSPRVRDATLAMCAGQLAAARHALEHGLAMNLARGFHHAVAERGIGYCPINGLALVAHRLPDRRVFVIDCDEHGGNGTEEFAAVLPNLHTASIFGTRFGCRGGVRSQAFLVRVPTQGFGAYRAALTEIAAELDRVRPDLILYQAGTDCHAEDPKSRARLSTRQLLMRDLLVMRMARRRGIPLAFCVAGGYQAAERLARLNLNTVRAAMRVFARD